jgi:hypothetical protein
MGECKGVAYAYSAGSSLKLIQAGDQGDENLQDPPNHNDL